MDDLDPRNWKSAVDTASGRTYWYHRKTRQSTWEMPKAIADMENQKNRHSIDIQSGSSFDSVKISQAPSPIDKAISEILSKPSDVRFSDICRELCDNLVKEKLVVSSAIDNLLECLVSFILGCGDVRCTINGLKLLWAMSLSTKYISYFAANTCWLKLVGIAARSNSFEFSIYLDSIIVMLQCSLARNAINETIVNERIEIGFNQMGNEVSKGVFDVLIYRPCSGFPTLLDSKILASLCDMSSRGFHLSTIVLQSLACYCEKFDKSATMFLEADGFNVLLRLLSIQAVPEELYERTKDIISLYMSASSYCSQRLLNAFSSLSRETSLLGHRSQLQDPRVLYSCLGTEDRSLDQNHASSDAFGPLGEYPAQLVPKDVTWTSKEGSTWRLTSLLIWAHCIELRPIIEDYWIKGGEDLLKLSLDASSATLDAICLFVHSGVLTLPPQYFDQLEVIKISNDLGMVSLQRHAIEAIFEKMTMDDVEITLEYSQAFRLSDLELLCNEFLQGNIIPTKPSVSRNASSVTNSPARQPSNENEPRRSFDMSSTLTLEDVVQASLQDMSDILTLGAAPLESSIGRTYQHDQFISSLDSGFSMNDMSYDPNQMDSRYEYLDDQTLSSYSKTSETSFPSSNNHTSDSGRGRKNGTNTQTSTQTYGQKKTGKSNAPNSGGIYALLLGNMGDDLQSSGSIGQSSMASSNTYDKSSVVTPLKAKSTNPVSSGKGGFQNKAASAEIMEFSMNMSLLPPPVISEREKRFAELSRPKPRTADKQVLSEENEDENEAVDAPASDALNTSIDSSSNISPAPKKTNTTKTTGIPSTPATTESSSKRKDSDSDIVVSVPKRAPPPVPIEPVTSTVTATVTATATPSHPAHATSTNPTPVQPPTPVTTKLQETLSNEMLSPTPSSFEESQSSPIPQPPTEPTGRGALLLLKSKARMRLSMDGKVLKPRTDVTVETPNSVSVTSNNAVDNTSIANDFEPATQSLPSQSPTRPKQPPKSLSAFVRTENTAHDVREQDQTNADSEDDVDVVDEEDESNYRGVEGQEQCPTCSRWFNSEPFSKHVRVCEKVFLKKRKVFDSSKKRVDNPEQKKLLETSKRAEKMSAAKKETESSDSNGKPLWKSQSDAFRQAMRAAREVKEALDRGDPLPVHVPSTPDPSLIPCPNCGRRFSQNAAERHIPICSSIKAKPTSLKKGSGGLGATRGLSTQRR